MVAEAPSSPDGELLFETRCSVCHGLGSAKAAIKSPVEWKETVERMVVENGAQLDPAEQELVTQYLIDTFVLDCCL
jgi:hypothetical protein